MGRDAQQTPSSVQQTHHGDTEIARRASILGPLRAVSVSPWFLLVSRHGHHRSCRKSLKLGRRSFRGSRPTFGAPPPKRTTPRPRSCGRRSGSRLSAGLRSQLMLIEGALTRLGHASPQPPPPYAECRNAIAVRVTRQVATPAGCLPRVVAIVLACARGQVCFGGSVDDPVAVVVEPAARRWLSTVDVAGQRHRFVCRPGQLSR